MDAEKLEKANNLNDSIQSLEDDIKKLEEIKEKNVVSLNIYDEDLEELDCVDLENKITKKIITDAVLNSLKKQLSLLKKQFEEL